MAPTTTDPVRVIVRLRTLGPAGLNPPQIEVIDRLRTLTEDDGVPIADLDIDVWGASVGVTRADDRDPFGLRDTVAEFTQWADAQGYTLQPAFEWRPAESADAGGRRRGRIVTPLITLAVYTGERLRTVYPHGDGDEVRTVHDGVEALESMAGDAAQSEGGPNETVAVPLR